MDTFREHLEKEPKLPGKEHSDFDSGDLFAFLRNDIDPDSNTSTVSRWVSSDAENAKLTRKFRQYADYCRAFQSWRRQFCEEFVVRMPAELKDMTYGHLLPPELHFHYNHAQLNDNHVISPYFWFPISSLFEEKHVGRHFAQDIFRFQYFRQSFDVYSCTQLKDVLTHRPRGLRIHFTHDLDLRGTSHTDVDSIFAGLIRQVQGIKAIEFALYYKPAQIATFLNVLAPTIFELKGHAVSVSVTRKASRHSRYSTDLTWIFEGNIDDFKKNILLNGKKRLTLVSGFIHLD
jgi:hypothetical protein